MTVSLLGSPVVELNAVDLLDVIVILESVNCGSVGLLNYGGTKGEVINFSEVSNTDSSPGMVDRT